MNQLWLKWLQTIKATWMSNFKYFIKIDIKDRIYTTRKDRKITDAEIEATNRIMEEVIQDMKENMKLWHISVMQYTTAVTLLARHGKLRERKNKKRDQKPRGWMINIKNKIDAIRRKLSHINLIIKYKKENIFTPIQRNIQKKLKRMYGSVRMERLIEMKTRLKHDLSV